MNTQNPSNIVGMTDSEGPSKNFKQLSVVEKQSSKIKVDSKEAPVDWNSYFISTKVYDSQTQIDAVIRAYEKSLGMLFVVYKSGYREKTHMVIYACERNGTYRPSTNMNPQM